MDIFNFSPEIFMSFLLTIMRVSLVVFLLPFFGGNNMPTTVKAALSLMLTLAIWPHIGFDASYFPGHPFNILILLLGELILGFTLGLMVHIILAGLQTGGQMIGFQMGFSMLTIADPSSGQQLVMTSFLVQMVAMALFLAMNGHLYILSALINSFELVKPGTLFIQDRLVLDMISLSAKMFSLAVRIAGPVIICLFMIDLSLAFMAKAAPQMNLLIIGFPIKIGIGLFFLGIVFTLIALYLDEFIQGLGPMFNNAMRMMQ